MRKAGVPIAVLVSGRGRTLTNLAERIDAGTLPARIVLVVGSSECPATAWAAARGLPTVIVPSLTTADQVEALAKRHGAEWLVLAGYIKHLPIPASLRGRIVNIHPALLPSFGGRGMYGQRVHRAVLDARATESGCTVHYVDDEYDHGATIAQARCRVEPGDTPESLAARVFELERELYPRVLAELFARETAQ